MTPACPLKIQEERHCIQRQLGNVRLLPSTGKPRAMFVVCFTCEHWIPEEEWKASTTKRRRVYEASRATEVGMPLTDRATRNYLGQNAEAASQKTARRLLP